MTYNILNQLKSSKKSDYLNSIFINRYILNLLYNIENMYFAQRFLAI